MTQLPNTAKVSEIITALQGLTGVNQKVELVAKLAAKGYTLTGNESMVELVAIVGSANLIDTTTAAGATVAQIMNGRVGFVNGAKVTGNNANLVDTTTALGTTAAQILAGREGFSNGAKVVGNMPSRGAVIVTPSTTDQLIALGFHDGTGKVIGDPDLIAANILSGVNIFGIVGSAQRRLFASGSASNAGSANFVNMNGGTSNLAYILVSGLAFMPSIVLVKKLGSVPTIWTNNGGYFLNSLARIMVGSVGYRTTADDPANAFRGYVNSGGFELPLNDTSAGAWEWYVYG